MSIEILLLCSFEQRHRTVQELDLFENTGNGISGL